MSTKENAQLVRLGGKDTTSTSNTTPARIIPQAIPQTSRRGGADVKQTHLPSFSAIKRAVEEHGRSGAAMVVVSFGGEPGEKEDAAWFRNHPHRRFRLRRFYPGEFTAAFDSPSTHALVRQIEPGLRVKLTLSSEADTSGEWLDKHLDANDTALTGLWMALRGSGDAGGVQ